ncbi:MAG: DegV family protein [Firmicutes bacterium]|nr:DegV family protein [Bacillota bacterium]MDI6704952.1 DegV family protein [Bacillota bacterium]
MSVTIITDSTADLPKEIIEEYDIKVLPLTVNFGDRTYRDGVDLTPLQFYELLGKSSELPTTSQINPPSFIAAYGEEIKKGNSVVSIHLSSKGSGTYQSAIIAKNTLDSDKIAVIDSLGYSMGFGIQVLEAARMAREGAGVQEIENRILAGRNRMQYIFGVDTLEYLKKGGRLSAARAAIATVMNIKPILQVKEGELEVLDKVRGRKKVISRIVEIASERGRDLSDQTMAIVHAECLEDAKKLRDMVEERFNPKEIIISDIGCVIGAHVGPGTLALFFRE